MITAERLREVLDYDPLSGAFTTRPNAKQAARTVAGSDTGHGHKQVVIDGKSYYLHRLAWLYVTGQFPNNNIDHINGDTADNRFVNLRDVTHSTNMQNLGKATARSLTGLLGVMPDKSRKIVRYRAHITVRGRRHHLGSFNSPEEAHYAYLKAKRRLHEGFVADRFQPAEAN